MTLNKNPFPNKNIRGIFLVEIYHKDSCLEIVDAANNKLGPKQSIFFYIYILDFHIIK